MPSPSLSEVVRAWLLAPVHDHLDHLENRMTLTAEAVAAEIDAETDRLAGVLSGMNERLAAALATDDGQKIKAAVSAELENVVEPSIDRLRAVGADPAAPVPPVEGTPAPAPVDPAPVTDAPAPVEDDPAASDTPIGDELAGEGGKHEADAPTGSWSIPAPADTAPVEAPAVDADPAATVDAPTFDSPAADIAPAVDDGTGPLPGTLPNSGL